MSRRAYLVLFLLGLAMPSMVAVFQRSPGYMDADYYYIGGMRLAQGKGFSEEILWNYLDDPVGLPHPSHAYWMPLASLVAALGMSLMRSVGFWAGKLGFILIAGLVPPLTARLAYSLSERKMHALLAGLLAAIPGFYLSYLATTDTFGVFMLLGACWFLLVGSSNLSDPMHLSSAIGVAFPLGVVSGLFHLARADGITWIGVAGLVVVFEGILIFMKDRDSGQVWRKLFRQGIILVALISGYTVVMGPWMARNLSTFGTLLSPGGLRAIWLTDYDELFIYPSGTLTFARWWGSGLAAIFQARWDALGQNLQTGLAVQGEIFLAPLVLWGTWVLRRNVRVRIGWLAWLVTLAVMTIIFPFAGWRGGFFHSGAAYQPLVWAIVPAGLDGFIAWGSRIRKWNVIQASRFFSAGLVCLAIMLSVLVAQKRVIGSAYQDPVWDNGWQSYVNLEQELTKGGITPDAIVMVNNAPGYYAANLREAISIPDGSVDTTLAVARRYGASILLLEQNHPSGLDDLYKHPANLPGMSYLYTYEGVHIFQILK